MILPGKSGNDDLYVITVRKVPEGFDTSSVSDDVEMAAGFYTDNPMDVLTSVVVALAPWIGPGTQVEVAGDVIHEAVGGFPKERLN